MEKAFCKCGCGLPAPIAKITNRRLGHKKGNPVRFIVGHRAKMQQKGDKSHSWKGGIIINSVHNRVRIYIPGHQRADKSGYVLRSILVVEKILGKHLPTNAVIHHHNKNRLDDINANLIVCENQAYHMYLHQRMRAYEGCGDSHWRKCSICKIRN